MAEMLNDKLNLEILENVCSGIGVSVNLSELARSLGKHRNTVRTRVEDLFKNNIITPPFYPFRALFKERPVLAVVKADLPRNEQVERFLIEDDTIFAAFWAWDGDYNTLMFEFHKNLFTYHQWKERIVKTGKIPALENRAPADVMFFDNELMIKYNPNSPIKCMENMFRIKGELNINGHVLDELSFKTLKKLLLGKGIKTNENLLAKKLGTHRRTMERRIDEMVKCGAIGRPLCRFPGFFAPPNYVLVLCMIRVNKNKEKIHNAIRSDCHVPIAYQGHTGKYNILYFGTFPNVESHFKWEEAYHGRFPGCFGAMKKLYLSPQMIASIDHQKVSMGIIKHRKESLHGRKIRGELGRQELPC